MNYYIVIFFCVLVFFLLRVIYIDDNLDCVLGVKVIIYGLSLLYLYCMEFIYYFDICVFLFIYVLFWFIVVVVLFVKC